MNRAAAIAIVLAGCGGPLKPPGHMPAMRAPVAVKALPQRADLPCFPCHSQLKFEKGPRFPHALSAHRIAGHCHTCHVGAGHHGREIDRTACLSCHEAGSEQLAQLARSDTSGK